jgi:hypothetical protein
MKILLGKRSTNAGPVARGTAMRAGYGPMWQKTARAAGIFGAIVAPRT